MVDTPRPRDGRSILLLLGASLSVLGYQSREGDQAYRLPLLLHHQAASVFASDPFVTALDRFNPHRGFLWLLDAASRPLGLSAGLFALYALTFALTYRGLARLARAAWPGAGPAIGPLAFALLLVAQAGNIGTNHLFGPMLLDRLVALALGWNALAALVERPDLRSVTLATALLTLAGTIHPSLGLQLTALSLATAITWGSARRLAAAPILALAFLPPLILAAGQPATLFDGLPPDQFRTWAAYVQSPQHLVPSLWRLPQWLAWACYPALAGLTLWTRPEPTHAPRTRLVLLLAINLLVLAVAWVAIEPLGDFRVMLLQPFRLATVARGLCLVLMARRVSGLWARDHTWPRLRASLLVVGLTNDWSLVVVTLTEITATVAERVGFGRMLAPIVLAAGLAFLARHDTASGHLALLVTLLLLTGVRFLKDRKPLFENNLPMFRGPRIRFAPVCVAWCIPALAALAPAANPFCAGARVLVNHCRFSETPRTDEERLAVWVRGHTPPDVRLVTPPGPKSFRLWSRRAVAFNRAASPYHAAGLADWAERFRRHVDFDGPPDAFARAYLADRQALEARYDALSGDALAALADSQGASFVVTRKPPTNPGGRLTPLAVEGRYRLYRVEPPQAVTAAERTSAGTG
jgi:hypothetical protein